MTDPASITLLPENVQWIEEIKESMLREGKYEIRKERNVLRDRVKLQQYYRFDISGINKFYISCTSRFIL